MSHLQLVDENFKTVRKGAVKAPFKRTLQVDFSSLKISLVSVLRKHLDTLDLQLDSIERTKPELKSTFLCEYLTILDEALVHAAKGIDCHNSLAAFQVRQSLLELADWATESSVNIGIQSEEVLESF